MCACTCALLLLLTHHQPPVCLGAAQLGERELQELVLHERFNGNLRKKVAKELGCDTGRNKDAQVISMLTQYFRCRAETRTMMRWREWKQQQQPQQEDGAGMDNGAGIGGVTDNGSSIGGGGAGGGGQPMMSQVVTLTWPYAGKDKRRHGDQKATIGDMVIDDELGTCELLSGDGGSHTLRLKQQWSDDFQIPVADIRTRAERMVAAIPPLPGGRGDGGDDGGRGGAGAVASASSSIGVVPLPAGVTPAGVSSTGATPAGALIVWASEDHGEQRAHVGTMLTDDVFGACQLLRGNVEGKLLVLRKDDKGGWLKCERTAGHLSLRTDRAQSDEACQAVEAVEAVEQEEDLDGEKDLYQVGMYSRHLLKDWCSTDEEDAGDDSVYNSVLAARHYLTPGDRAPNDMMPNDMMPADAKSLRHMVHNTCLQLAQEEGDIPLEADDTLVERLAASDLTLHDLADRAIATGPDGWGGFFELTVMARALRCHILTYTLGPKGSVYYKLDDWAHPSLPCSSARVIVLLRVADNHYKYILPRVAGGVGDEGGGDEGGGGNAAGGKEAMRGANSTGGEEPEVMRREELKATRQDKAMRASLKEKGAVVGKDGSLLWITDIDKSEACEYTDAWEDDEVVTQEDDKVHLKYLQGVNSVDAAEEEAAERVRKRKAGADTTKVRPGDPTGQVIRLCVRQWQPETLYPHVVAIIMARYRRTRGDKPDFLSIEALYVANRKQSSSTDSPDNRDYVNGLRQGKNGVHIATDLVAQMVVMAQADSQIKFVCLGTGQIQCTRNSGFWQRQGFHAAAGEGAHAVMQQGESIDATTLGRTRERLKYNHQQLHLIKDMSFKDMSFTVESPDPCLFSGSFGDQVCRTLPVPMPCPESQPTMYSKVLPHTLTNLSHHHEPPRL